jgi:hypothetical protein
MDNLEEIMSVIEFRVQGSNSAAVAQELADQMKVRFGVSADIQVTPKPAPAERDGEKMDVHTMLIVVDAAIVLYHAYSAFIHEPAEKGRQKLVRKWEELVLWARSKLPTTVRAVIGVDSLLLHDSEPERLHHLTKHALQNVLVTVE